MEKSQPLAKDSSKTAVTLHKVCVTFGYVCLCLKTARQGDEVTDDCRSFQNRVAATGNAWSPIS